MNKQKRYWKKNIRKALRKINSKKSSRSERKALRISLNSYVFSLIALYDKEEKKRNEKEKKYWSAKREAKRLAEKGQ